MAFVGTKGIHMRCLALALLLWLSACAARPADPDHRFIAASPRGTIWANQGA
jgi:hypothetical protein